MNDITLALDLEGVLITNAVSQFPRSGLKQFLVQCEGMFGRENLCVYTTVNQDRFRKIVQRLADEGMPLIGFPSSDILTGWGSTKT
jgi:hypothetical protein